MTWLSEIEHETKKVLDGDRKMELRLFHCFKRMERMARVLREQSVYIGASHAVEEACADFNPVDIDGLRKARKEAWENMSDDAKELIPENEEL